MSSVSCSESIIDENVPQACKLFSKVLIVLCLLFSESYILQKHNLPVFKLGSGFLYFFIYNSVGAYKHDFSAEELR